MHRLRLPGATVRRASKQTNPLTQRGGGSGKHADDTEGNSANIPNVRCLGVFCDARTRVRVPDAPRATRVKRRLGRQRLGPQARDQARPHDHDGPAYATKAYSNLLNAQLLPPLLPLLPHFGHVALLPLLKNISHVALPPCLTVLRGLPAQLRRQANDIH